jgi:hypothetical protein
MARDEDEVRTLLLDTEVPPSRLEVGQLLAAGRRSHRRWRMMKATGMVAAVVAVAAPAVVVATGHWPSRSTPERFAEFAATAVVSHVTASVDDMAPCTNFPFRAPDAGDAAPIVDADATGELAVGSEPASPTVTLWTRERPAAITVPGTSEVMGFVAAVAVNSAGTVVGVGGGSEPAYNWIYRSGEVRRLPLPAGHTTSTVRDLNEMGDALGLVGSPAGLVVWPADEPDAPRVIDGQNLDPVGLRDDGTVIATGTDEDGYPALVFVRPNGSRHAVRIPAEITGFDIGINRDRFAFVRGDLLFATAWIGSVSHPVRWNLRTGTVEIFDNLTGPVTAGTAGGWLMTTDGDRAVAVPPAAVTGRGTDGAMGGAMGGVARRLGEPGSVLWVSAGGSVMIANTPYGPVTWRC